MSKPTITGNLNQALWLVTKGSKASVVASVGTPTGYSTAQQVGAVGDTFQQFETKFAAALFNMPSGTTIPATFTLPGGGKIGIGTSNILSTGAGALQNLFTGGVGAALNSPTGSTGTSIAGTSILPGIWDALTTPSNWLRALEVLVGAVLVYMALRSMTGAGPGAGTVKTAAKAAAA